MDNNAWVRAGMFGEDGDRFGRPVASDTWRIPAHVEIIGEDLVWRQSGSSKGQADAITVRVTADFQVVRLAVDENGVEREDDPDGERQSGPDLLYSFLKLRDAPPEKVLAYAQNSGVLELCEHGLPYTHHRSTVRDVDPMTEAITEDHMREIFESCYPHFAEDGVHEPIATWRQFAERAYYLVDAAAQMEKLTSAQKQWLFARVEHWLDLGGVRPLIRFENDKPRVSLGSGTLFGALGVQLMLVVTKTDGLAICSYCGDAYIPRKRRPKAGQRSYCECCRDAGRKADAQRDHKRRLKDAKVLLRRGKSPKEICRRIGGRVATYERLAREKKEQKTRRRSR